MVLVSGLLWADMMGGYYTILLLLRLGRLVVVGSIVRSHALVRESVGRAHHWKNSRIVVRNGSDIMSIIIMVVQLWMSVVVC